MMSSQVKSQMTPSPAQIRGASLMCLKGVSSMNKMWTAAIVSLQLAAANFAIPVPAHAEESYDLDCAVILCLAGGFPLGCAAAFDHMIDRLTHIPPKSPFGFCSMSDGSKYTDYDAPYRRLSSFDPESWHCADGLKLHHKIKRTDNGRRKVTAFCYESISYQWRGFGEDRHKVTIYNGKQDATPLNFQIQITVDPGTAEQYKSPTYKINTRSGLVVEQQQ